MAGAHQSIRLRRAARSIQISRDASGVARIHGQSWEDALYGLGYAQALDRRTQFLFGREVARGRASERLADTPALRSRDRLFRDTGLSRHTTQETTQLSDETLRQLELFCAGVNDGLAQTGPSLPMRLVGLRPEPWQPADVILMGKLLSFGALALGQQRAETHILELLRCGTDPDLLKAFYAPHLNHVDFPLLKQVHFEEALSDAELERLEQEGLLPHLAGSNAWAVGPGKSRSGNALLASDPHLDIGRLPAVWYEAVLEWGEGNYLLGATLPGTPLVAVGRTRALSWGLTYAMGEICDYFIEDCRVRGTTVQYRRADQWHDFRQRTETISHRRGDPTTLQIRWNEQGVLRGDPLKKGDGLYLSAAWTGQTPGAHQSVEVWLGLLQCQDVQQAMAVVRECPEPPLCWVFADRQGHIGRQVCGRFPRRQSNHSGLAPVPAWDEGNHWQGFVPTEQLPSEYDPPCGFVVSANEDLNREGGPLLTTLPEQGYRRQRLADQLENSSVVTLSDCQQWQYDVYSLQAERILEVFLPGFPPGPIRDRLVRWDRRFTADSTTATLFWDFYKALLLEFFGKEAPQGFGQRRLRYLMSGPSWALVGLSHADESLCDLRSPWWQGRKLPEVVQNALTRVDASRLVPWGEENYVFLGNQFLPGAFGWMLRMHPGQIPLIGSYGTPHQGTVSRRRHSQASFAPSYHFVTDLGTDQAETNMPGGASESRFSRHYLSDLARWQQAQYKVIQPSATTPSSPPPEVVSAENPGRLLR